MATGTLHMTDPYQPQSSESEEYETDEERTSVTLRCETLDAHGQS